MGRLKPGASYVYESPDGGKSTYAREVGAAPSERFLIGYSLDMIDHLEKIDRESRWLDILNVAETNPTLKDAVDRAIVIYELIKGEDPPQWHPV